MPEIEIGNVKVQPRKRGSFMVTIPSAVAKVLQIKDNESAKVFVDVEKKRFIYQL